MANAQNKRTGGAPRKGSMPFFFPWEQGQSTHPHHELLLPPGKELVGATPTPDGRSINLRLHR